MNAPTPADFARELATRFGPKPDPTNPFFQPVEIATHRLLIQAVSEVFGPEDPFAQFAKAYERAYRLMVPVHWSGEDTAECLEASLDNMRAAWEVIERDTVLTIDDMRG
ncbi:MULTISPECIES: hypothetical protein [Marivita]|uniref:Uncharacterized protein n=1 Tax=Marivita cryptomonadis TaxID=505252 RepID=A0A9Q2NWG0_9RHOB|nr:MULTISPECIES: hypothetical protein [Marivita]MCR9168923.1 hypothetical protein [Paracoccaceae bacterium]MBM2322465.1 hypothetical protein [Marivita cryptomonadis]MBM2332047.1 hypothetical protein [Marivita cryptomonadis]MBM2341631.1 hypothetical protein [Marivita cryptomonadis]MBM2346295.1 hypothetical protein [Marivita cryptomonadis]